MVFRCFILLLVAAWSGQSGEFALYKPFKYMGNLQMQIFDVDAHTIIRYATKHDFIGKSVCQWEQFRVVSSSLYEVIKDCRTNRSTKAPTMQSSCKIPIDELLTAIVLERAISYQCKSATYPSIMSPYSFIILESLWIQIILNPWCIHWQRKVYSEILYATSLITISYYLKVVISSKSSRFFYTLFM